jgi:tRNA threonylcarbamoyladenosine biosynthesis protein TsaE
MKQVHASGPADTMALAAQLAADAQPGDLFCLRGTLGMGKSVFARAFIHSLCGEDTDVPSPTFTLVQTYDSPAGPIAHFDLYRLNDPDEVLALDWDATMADAICLVEWPERAGPYLPRTHTDVVFTAGTGPESRMITVQRHD